MTTPSTIRADACCKRLQWDDLDIALIKTLIGFAKFEDLLGGGLKEGTSTPGDHSSNLLPEEQIAHANIVAREDIVVCGIHLANELLANYDTEISMETDFKDGDSLRSGETIARINGPVRSLLSAERPMLNFMQMLSGVSTMTRRYVDTLADSKTRLLDTRKTTPGFRSLEKYAVACGGGWNHRIGLFDRVMLKDNHLAAFGPDPRKAAIAATQASRERFPNMLVEIEVDSIDQIDIALAAEADIVLLDNFSRSELADAVSKIDGRIVTEASGGITLETLSSLSNLGLDFISTGALVHKSPWIDIALDWSPKQS